MPVQTPESGYIWDGDGDVPMQDLPDPMITHVDTSQHPYLPKSYDVGARTFQRSDLRMKKKEKARRKRKEEARTQHKEVARKKEEEAQRKRREKKEAQREKKKEKAQRKNHKAPKQQKKAMKGDGMAQDEATKPKPHYLKPPIRSFKNPNPGPDLQEPRDEREKWKPAYRAARKEAAKRPPKKRTHNWTEVKLGDWRNEFRDASLPSGKKPAVPLPKLIVTTLQGETLHLEDRNVYHDE